MINKLVYFSLLFLFSTGLLTVSAQETSINLSSPQQTIITHLTFLQEDNFQPEKSAKTIFPGVVKNEEAKALGIKLKQIYDGAGLYIDVDLISNDRNYYDSTSRKNRYYITDRFPEIYLSLHNGNWYYSRRTVESVDRIHKRIYPFGVDKLLIILPKMGTREFLGLHLWQHITLFLIILIAIISHKILTFFFNRILLFIFHRYGYKESAEKYLLPVAKPFSLLVVFSILMILVPILQLPIKINHYIIYTIRGSLPFFATLVAYRAVDVIAAYLEKISGRTDNSLDDQLIPLIKKVMKIFVVVVGALFILNNLDYNINALLAGVSIGGLALALAAQDTLKNFFASVMIFLDKPFKKGDWITSGEVDGTVEEVGFRATRIRTFRNSLVYVPNARLSDSSIDNHGARQYRRFYTTITITYDTPAAAVEAFVEGLRMIIENHPDTRKDFYNVYFNDLGSHSLNIMFYVFFAVPTWGEELRCRHEILLEVIKLADEMNIRFAFPTQTLHVEEFPGQESLSPQHTISSEDLKTKVSAYFSKK